VQAQSERIKISGYVLDSNGRGIAKKLTLSLMSPRLFQVFLQIIQVITKLMVLRALTTLTFGHPSIQTTLMVTKQDLQLHLMSQKI